MQVFLIRHALAADETLALGDAHRPLTAAGRLQAKQLGAKLRWYDCGLTHVWSSPLVRAVQTAELVIGGFDHDLPIDIAPALAPDGSHKGLLAALHALPHSASIMLVGHEPGMSHLGGVILGDPGFPPLAKAEAARIVDGKLRWRFAWDADAPLK